jgi:hypothetical protein
MMLRYTQKLMALTLVALFVSAVWAHADEEIEDLIDLFESNSKIIAIAEGKRRFVADLGLKERVLWSDSRGYLGAFLTDSHFFVVSTTSGGWQALPLRLGESGKKVGVLSSYIALLVTESRAVGFDAATDRFVETRLPKSVLDRSVQKGCLTRAVQARLMAMLGERV